MNSLEIVKETRTVGKNAGCEGQATWYEWDAQGQIPGKGWREGRNGQLLITLKGLSSNFSPSSFLTFVF